MALTRLAHILMLYKVSYHKKILAFQIVTSVAFILLIVSIFSFHRSLAFEVCIFTCLLHGGAHAFGESVLVGFFKFFPSEAINIFSSGTGFSDCLILITILFFKNFNVFYGYTMMSMLMLIVPFYFCFNWINKKKRELVGSNQELLEKYALDED
mmetsp:Transcript_45971/g.33728  ORF Transcript_45971/g.33728 Transcript_45971/m.33728 type:complete len:154 (+) Transcript_45971:302-763(+)|eukprot:CAMPEP_0202978232 /NCGR_PEP_ID=MMETSP1396-20130829/84727_1 /ASSEMBLY_ACC=CAM_ASM_000872 /TAXON_ID= /ORGANISM="Pseudokeronopsis sp., Strain Brazil" /LENGTH=153 /DNA_ID=CAMNT_0049717141 /DNA_START=302 /DNA_END=763 /DNA_ORIENTATION=-